MFADITEGCCSPFFEVLQQPLQFILPEPEKSLPAVQKESCFFSGFNLLRVLWQRLQK